MTTVPPAHRGHITVGWSAADHGVSSPQRWWASAALPRLVATIREAQLPWACAIALTAYHQLYGVPLLGRTRAVYRTGGGHVIKIPHTWEGLHANHVEADLAHASHPEIPMAPTELVPVEHLPAVVAAAHGRNAGIARAQEVAPVRVSDYSKFPMWVRHIDCAQVGYLPCGRLVAYDI
ncbi:hypothetical protein [Nocardia asiatica]|uniref:hypothetical protein n=1 Tax=Nocardia asiatica TaxID=209252 RepID=UPI00030A6BD5|nr:hypothetical protein [Nocardia asiatica]